MTERARYWAAQLAAWERSGLNQAEFCRRRRIKAGSFGWWKRKLQGTGKNGRHRVNRGVSTPRRGPCRPWPCSFWLCARVLRSPCWVPCCDRASNSRVKRAARQHQPRRAGGLPVPSSDTAGGAVAATLDPSGVVLIPPRLSRPPAPTTGTPALPRPPLHIMLPVCY